MSDIRIDVGYLGKDVIAICKDYHADYAFHARYVAKNGEYVTKLQSTHGLTTTGRFKEGTGARQMVMIALSKHMEIVDKRMQKDNEPTNKPQSTAALH